MPGTKYRVLPF